MTGDEGRASGSVTPSQGSHICDDWNAQVSHVGDDLTVLGRDLSMLDQLVQVLLCDA